MGSVVEVVVLDVELVLERSRDVDGVASATRLSRAEGRVGGIVGVLDVLLPEASRSDEPFGVSTAVSGELREARGFTGSTADEDEREAVSVESEVVSAVREEASVSRALGVIRVDELELLESRDSDGRALGRTANGSVVVEPERVELDRDDVLERSAVLARFEVLERFARVEFEDRLFGIDDEDDSFTIC